MKVYRVETDYNNNYDGSSSTLGTFSTEEKAQAAGKHYCDKLNSDDDGYDLFYYEVFVETIDEYYIENLTSLAKAVTENE